MPTKTPPAFPWPQLSDLITRKMGLCFPPERWPDFRRSLEGAAKEFGFAEVDACAEWLLSTDLTKAQIHALASHLTIGETYFFRGKRTFEVLAETILPELVESRRSHGKRLRIWSAACCTGEEPYSLAILLEQVIPDLADWRVTILATDINERFLRQAAAGVYGEWAFRETPESFKSRYFDRTPEGRYAILPRIKQAVSFAPLNLVEDVFPALATDTNAMDLIFCRNALMYFAPPEARKVVRNLGRALADDGWLAVSPSEGAQAALGELTPVHFAGAILYRKGEAKAPSAPVRITEAAIPSAVAAWALPDEPWPAPPPSRIEKPGPEAPSRTAHTTAALLYQEGRWAEAADTLLASLGPGATPAPEALSLLTRWLANQGRLADALAWCDRWIAADRLDSSSRYLRAVVLQELGDHGEARRELQRTLYLRPDFALAHFALGNLARADGKREEAQKQFGNALHLLQSCQPDDLLPESDGLTAGRLSQIITAIVSMDANL